MHQCQAKLPRSLFCSFKGMGINCNTEMVQATLANWMILQLALIAAEFPWMPKKHLLSHRAENIKYIPGTWREGIKIQTRKEIETTLWSKTALGFISSKRTKSPECKIAGGLTHGVAAKELKNLSQFFTCDQQ